MQGFYCQIVQANMVRAIVEVNNKQYKIDNTKSLNRLDTAAQPGRNKLHCLKQQHEIKSGGYQHEVRQRLHRGVFNHQHRKLEGKHHYHF